MQKGNKINKALNKLV